VTSVSDADTIVVSGIGKVRLAGISRADQQVRLGPTGPPTRPPSNPAMPPPLVSAGVNLSPDRSGQKALRELVLGKDVKVEYDELSGDDSGTRKAYVFLPDGTLVNAEMLRQGRARLDTATPFTRLEEFKDIEEQARGAGRGIWAEVRR
jgi:micrococcal nuclease